MLKYNNDHLITGYIKQLLNGFNLPTYKIYSTRDTIAYNNNEFANVELLQDDTTNSNNAIQVQVEKYIIPTTKKQIMPYIKDGSVQIYQFDTDKKQYVWQIINLNSDSFLTKLYNHQKTFPIKNNIYDSATHTYLGDFLRYTRDKNNLDLMSLYNCFSNEMPQNLDCSFEINVNGKTINNSFSTKDPGYKIYMLPVKYFQEYTIALSCNQPVELFCGFYDTKLIVDTDKKMSTFWKSTYQRLSPTTFSNPVLYSKLLSDQVRNILYNADLKEFKNINFTILEENLKLFIKLPVQTETSFTILEGNYLGYNDRQYKLNNTNWNNKAQKWENKSFWMQNYNHSIINFENFTEKQSDKLVSFKPITYLQLLALDTKVSHPFADRLIEYLLGNAITNMEGLPDNIKRIQQVMADNKIITPTGYQGLWDDSIRLILYSYMNNHAINSENNHDILGYVDKDVEKLYESKNYKKDLIINTLNNVDIYEDIYLATKVKSYPQH